MSGVVFSKMGVATASEAVCGSSVISIFTASSSPILGTSGSMSAVTISATSCPDELDNEDELADDAVEDVSTVVKLSSDLGVVEFIKLRDQFKAALDKSRIDIDPNAPANMPQPMVIEDGPLAEDLKEFLKDMIGEDGVWNDLEHCSNNPLFRVSSHTV